jgi:hypothetical protein
LFKIILELFSKDNKRKIEKKKRKEIEKQKGPRGSKPAQLEKEPTAHLPSFPNRYHALLS